MARAASPGSVDPRIPRNLCLSSAAASGSWGGSLGGWGSGRSAWAGVASARSGETRRRWGDHTVLQLLVQYVGERRGSCLSSSSVLVHSNPERARQRGSACRQNASANNGRPRRHGRHGAWQLGFGRHSSCGAFPRHLMFDPARSLLGLHPALHGMAYGAMWASLRAGIPRANRRGEVGVSGQVANSGRRAGQLASPVRAGQGSQRSVKPPVLAAALPLSWRFSG